MKERTLRDYLTNKINIDILAADLVGSQKKTSYDVTTVYVDKINEEGDFEITRDHLKRICDGAITGHLDGIDLNTIAYALIASEYFTWEKEGKTSDGKIIDETINDWDDDLGFPRTLKNFKCWREFLETGVYTLDVNQLRRAR